MGTRSTINMSSYHTRLDVLLVVMPFGPIFQPSLGASILRQMLSQAGLHTQIEYLSIRFVEVIGLKAYEKISEYYPDTRKLFGEWIFSHALYPTALSIEAAEKYIGLVNYRDSPHSRSIEELCQAVGSYETDIQNFLNDANERILELNPRLVGFTSMFQQHVSSLALAKKIKATSPDVFITFGGANVEGPMGRETLRSFPWVDAIVSGPGEVALPLIARSIVDGQPLPAIAGVNYQPTWRVDSNMAQAPELALDDIPPIDFQDFFNAYAQSKALSECGIVPSVLLETSRGCWWGQKHHCTFCGLNGAQMKFRMKSADRAISDLKHLARAYPRSRIVVTDNIMPQSYYRDVIPRLDKREFPSGLFFEVKSNVTEEQIADLAQAGVDVVQVGIENFSPPILNHMRKGVSCVSNIAFLKYCAVHGIRPNWILLNGFASETVADYKWNISVCRLIRHLTPPQACSEIRIDRFSPNHSEPSQFGFESIRPVAAYSEIYRTESIRLEEIAYFFEADVLVQASLAAYKKELNDVIGDWQSRYHELDLWAISAGEEDVIVDSRNGDDHPVAWLLDSENAAILRASERRTSVDALCKLFGEPTVLERMTALEERGLLVREGASLISLPLRLDRTRRRPSERTYNALIEAGVVGTERDGRSTLQLSFGTVADHGITVLQGST
jgi:ribosomal peptide maturation radical SAM protein 1